VFFRLGGLPKVHILSEYDGSPEYFGCPSYTFAKTSPGTLFSKIDIFQDMQSVIQQLITDLSLQQRAGQLTNENSVSFNFSPSTFLFSFSEIIFDCRSENSAFAL
jgi:hypothetical protein